jgi:hypothetical protein
MFSQTWSQIFGVIGAIVIGVTAWLRLADAPPCGGASGADRHAGQDHGLTTR